MVALGAVYDVRTFGAKGDGEAKDTAALQCALDECAKTGGKVVVPAGTYWIGSIYLGDNTELRLDEGATLLGSPDLSDYNEPDAYPQNWGSVREGWSARRQRCLIRYGSYNSWHRSDTLKGVSLK